MATTVYDLTTSGGLPAGWSRIGVTSAAETWSASGLSVALGAKQGYTVPVSAGDFTLDVAVTSDSASSAVMFGPWIIGASNAGVAHGLCGSWYHSPAGCLLLQMDSLGYGSNFAALGAGKPQPYRIRIRYEAATRKGYLSFSSTGGASWSIESTALTMAVDAARVGFGQILGSSTTHVVTEVKVTDSSSGAITGALAATLPGPLS